MNIMPLFSGNVRCQATSSPNDLHTRTASFQPVVLIQLKCPKYGKPQNEQLLNLPLKAAWTNYIPNSWVSYFRTNVSIFFSLRQTASACSLDATSTCLFVLLSQEWSTYPYMTCHHSDISTNQFLNTNQQLLQEDRAQSLQPGSI